MLRATRGKLAAHEPIAEQGLYEIFAMAGIGDTAVGSKGIAVPLTTNNGERYIAHVLPSHLGRTAARRLELRGGRCPFLGIAEGTIKTHLRDLFAKTGTRRQADLVKLVVGFSNPLLG